MKITRENLKGLVKNNLELKILAVVVAILAWLYVYHVEIYLPQMRNKSTHEAQK
ncbi:MAG: hypothetical protein WC338_07350 [Candidatus Ratteibacteria bacterium]|jgi:hypothetical protein